MTQPARPQPGLAAGVMMFAHQQAQAAFSGQTGNGVVAGLVINVQAGDVAGLPLQGVLWLQVDLIHRIAGAAGIQPVALLQGAGYRFAVWRWHVGAARFADNALFRQSWWPALRRLWVLLVHGDGIKQRLRAGLLQLLVQLHTEGAKLAGLTIG